MINERYWLYGLVALWVLLINLAMGTAVGNATARPVARADWTPEAKLTLARSLVGEADFREQDHAAIAWVYAKRYRLCRRNLEVLPVCDSFEAFVTGYSAPLKVKSPRARSVQALPWGDPQKGPYKRWRNSWRKVRQWVERWGRGRIKDPCPSAIHFGGDMDAPHWGWEPVKCGTTANTFYRPKRRPRGES